MWYGQDMMWYTLLYEMIMFCRSYRQLGGALCLSLYCMKCKRHVIALLYHYVLPIVVEAIVGETTTALRWRSRCQAGDDGDHDGALEIEIKGTRWWWPYHVTYFDCMWCLSFMHLILLSTWYVSNVSIIFDCSMLYYLLFWTILDFIFHFYIIFGTNCRGSKSDSRVGGRYGEARS